MGTPSSAPPKLDAKGIRFDKKPDNWDLFKQSAEAHAGIVGCYPARYSRTSVHVYPMLSDVELHAARSFRGELQMGKTAFHFLQNATGDIVSQQIVFRADSPSEAWSALHERYSPSSAGAGEELYQRL